MELVKSVYSGNEVEREQATYVPSYGFVADDEIQNAIEDGEIIVCAGCGDIIARDIAELGANNDWYCQECFGERFVICDHCGEPEWACDTHEVHIGNARYNTTETWCDACVDGYAYRCDDCGEYFDEQLTEVHNGDIICDSCLEDYRHCDECDDWYPEDEGEWDEDEDRWICHNCLSEKCDRRIIHDYHAYKADLVFLGDSDRHKFLHMGVELEIDGAGEYSENAFQIVEAGNNGINDTITCMHDGSLRKGFELISQPATLQYHCKRYGWDKMMAEAKKLGYKSHDIGTCGMHVHVDRQYFYDAFVDPEFGLALLAVNNRKWLMQFSRRTDYYYCPFPTDQEDYGMQYVSDDFNCKKCEKAGKRDGEARLRDLRYSLRCHYSCINMSSHPTIEFRFFRGTLKFSTFVANLQLVQMMCYAVKTFRYEQLCNINFHWFMALAKRRGYTEFINYASRRMRGFEDAEVA